MDLNSNLRCDRKAPFVYNHAQLRDSTDLLDSEHPSYINVSNYPYNIVTNRRKPNRVSLPSLVAAETKANKVRTFLAYWNNENFFDPIRNSKERFEGVSGLARKKSDPNVVKYTQPTSLPAIRVLAAHRIQKHCKF